MKTRSDRALSPFFEALEKESFSIDSAQQNQFADFYDLLIYWNSRINLIGRKEKDIVHRHFLNSIAVASFRRFGAGEKIIDLGSGGGFPAILLKILFPASSFLLVESVRKKSGFLDEVIRQLDLRGIETRTERVENLSQDNRYKKQFNIVTARALAPLHDLVPMAAPFLKTGGEMLFLKGKNFANEIRQMEKNELSGNMSVGVTSLNASKLFDEIQEGVLITVKQN